MRFFNEFLRVDSFRVSGFLKLSHIVMIILFLIGIIGTYISLKSAKEGYKIIGNTIKIFILVSVCAAIIILSMLSVIKP